MILKLIHLRGNKYVRYFDSKDYLKDNFNKLIARYRWFYEKINVLSNKIHLFHLIFMNGEKEQFNSWPIL